MPPKFVGFSRRGPDNVTEELVAALSTTKAYEFKALFDVIHTALKARSAASGGEEMLRLRTYDKLQGMVAQGQVKKTGKQYKGVAKPIRQLSEQLKELRANNHAFVPRPANTPKAATTPPPAKAATSKGTATKAAAKAAPVRKVAVKTRAAKTAVASRRSK